MAKITLNEILTKLAYIYTKDVYILAYKDCIGGKYSEELNEGLILSELDNDFSSILKDELGDKSYIYISDIKKAKKDPDIYIKKLSISEANDILEKFRDKNSKFKNVKKWNTLNFSDEDVEDIFTLRNIHWLFDEDTDEINIQVAKSTFPLLSEKNAKDTDINYYTIKPKNTTELATIYLYYMTEHIKISEIIEYFDISEIDK